jgi:hypothetical protein
MYVYIYVYYICVYIYILRPIVLCCMHQEESLKGWMLGCDGEGRPLVRLTGLGMCERLGQRMAFALAPSFKRAAGRSEPE